MLAEQGWLVSRQYAAVRRLVLAFVPRLSWWLPAVRAA